LNNRGFSTCNATLEEALTADLADIRVVIAPKAEVKIHSTTFPSAQKQKIIVK